MIYVFTGKPRAGKSYAALREMYDEAVSGNRVIVTNLPVDGGRLSALIQKRYPDADFDPIRRLRVLTTEECAHFWRCRMIDLAKANMGFQDLHKSTPTLFVIDEAHMFFDARGWKQQGVELTEYNSQHAKLGDHVIFVTQFLDLIDKRVKGFAQEFHHFRNLGFERFWGFFDMPQRFLRSVYYTPPVRTDKPDTFTYSRMDMELAACYDTSAGVGVIGQNRAESRPKRKGFSMKWLVVAAVLFLLAINYGPEYLGKKFFGKVRGMSEDVVKPATARDPVVAPSVTNKTVLPTAVPTVKDVYVTAFMQRGSRWKITLSDGRYFTDETGGVEAAGRDWIRTADGHTYYRR